MFPRFGVFLHFPVLFVCTPSIHMGAVYFFYAFLKYFQEINANKLIIEISYDEYESNQ
jgi:hypothetical protein